MDPLNIIRQAVELARHGDKPQARRLVSEILQDDPSNADAWVVMAQVVDDPEEAIACMQKALDLRPEDEHARRYLDFLQQQNTAAPSSTRLPVSPALIAGVVAALVLICVIAALLSGLPLNQAASSEATSAISCRELIDRALTLSDSECQYIDQNQVCYGHTTVKASLQPGADGIFEKAGDVLSIDHLARLSAAPLDLNTREWGVGIFKLEANLPYTVPGQLVTMVIAGDTAIDDPSGGMEVFTFSSGIGGIDCESVPVNGLIVRMPDGTGIRFQVNGTELALSGDAFLQAEFNRKMQISMLDGGGWISSDGESQFFQAGETASVPLAGLVSDGPPVVGPNPVGDLCLLFNTCVTGSPTKSPGQSVALLQTAVTESAGAVPVNFTGPTSTPVPVDPRLPTFTPVPIDPSIPTNTPVPVAPGQPTNTPVPLPTNTAVPRPTNTPVPPPTSTPGTGSTSSTNATATRTPTPVPTNTPKPPTNTPVPPTDTPVPTATPVPTDPPPVSCSNIALALGSVSGSTLSINVTNLNVTAVTITHIDISWPASNGDLIKLKLGSTFGNDQVPVAPPSASIDAVAKKSIVTSDPLELTFASAAVDTGYTITLSFDIGCSAPTFSN